MLSIEVMKASGRFKQSGRSIERKRTQFKNQPREQPRDERNPGSVEVIDIKRMSEKESGHGRDSAARSRRCVQKSVHPFGQLGKGNFNGVLRARCKQESVEKCREGKNEEGNGICRKLL